ncbi:PrsW family intramembrane metalloprotease [Mariniluteicoccus flavus]
MRSADLARRKSFAVKPDEPVASFALVSTIMPRGASERPQTYRLALMISLTAALLAAIFGALPIAVLLAAFAIPVVYIVYLYDVNLWEDEPVIVTALAFVLTGLLGAAFLWAVGRFISPVTAPGFGGLAGGGGFAPQLVPMLVWALLVPVIGELIRQIGPLVLAARPEFDDLMDGLTFGIISGVAFATADTLVRHWGLLTGGFVNQLDPGLWASLIFLEGFVKPLIMGTATGIACAEFSGLGEGYDGFSARWVRGVGEAILANVAYALGIQLLSQLANPTLRVMLQVIWALAILAVLIIRVRTVLHHGLMEAALEAHARQGVGDHEGVGEGRLEFCPSCEMPLVAGAAFCNACGANSRTRTKAHRDRTPVAATTAAATPEGAHQNEEEGR